MGIVSRWRLGGIDVRELSLFTGAGGGLQGSLLLGWQPVGYVEYNDYCQRVIRARIDDGTLPNAPIFGNIKSFLSDGYAESYTGLVDIVSGGFPCQPFSTAGEMLGEHDPRNLWPETIATIRITRPRYAFLENVPGLLANGYFGTILRELSESGYDARWGVFSACAFGAPHTRERLFILAYSVGARMEIGWECKNGTAGIKQRDSQERCHYTTSSKRFPQIAAWSDKETDILRVADGVGTKLERIRAIGNGQVPVVVKTAWELLSSGIE